ncbi:MAG TPA: winged helix DNA-binding domain-containing protein, partial [Anaerolineae bacterium]|nr:winged helix DNA-binding domain-containing protein [Anaerolineae bacterium]
GPIFIRASRGRRAQLGLDEASGERAVAALCDALGEHGPLTRDEIVEKLAGRGVALAGQARPHLLGLAALQGLVCHGPLRGRQPTYVLTADWIDPGPTLPRDEALARLALRYLTAFAPAAPEDFATWSGLSLTEARAGWQQIAAQLAEVRVGPARAWMLKTQEAWVYAPEVSRPVVRLLPNFDNYLLGYRDRSLILTDEQARRVNSGGGMLHPLLLIDGRGAGMWKLERGRAGINVSVEPFDELDAAVLPGLAAEIDDVGRFLSEQRGAEQ